MDKITDDERMNIKIREFEQSSDLRLSTREKWLFKAGYMMGSIERSNEINRERAAHIKEQIEGAHNHDDQ